MEWEKPYIEALIDTLQPFGEVLEVGFSLGYAANKIHSFPIKQHTIIESDPEIAKEAIKWAKAYSNVTVIEAPWQNVLPNLGVFDAIFFNECSLDTLPSIQPQGIENLVLQRGKEVLAMVEKELPQLKTIRYSDHDLDEFYQAVGRFQPEEMPRFLSELKANGQIQNEQYERMIEKYHIQRETPKINVLVERRVDHSFAFLEACLKKHMQKGSRFSCFSNDPTSKYENPQFFEQIITNSDLDYQEKLIPVTVPETCEYYKHKEALVILIEKAT